MNEDEKRSVLSNRFVVDPIEIEVDNSAAEGEPFDFSVEGDAYISLAEAWALFCDKEAASNLFEAMESRPRNGSTFRDLVRNPDTWELEAEPIDGPDYEPGKPNGMAMTRLVAAFRELVALKLNECTFCEDHTGMCGIAFRDWWPQCEPLFFESYIHRAPDLRDGGPKSWDAIRPAKSFPIAVYFDRAAFDALEVVKKWAQQEAPPPPMWAPSAAYGAALDTPWMSTPSIALEALDAFGYWLSLDDVLDKLASGNDLAERMRAAHWLFERAAVAQASAMVGDLVNRRSLALNIFETERRERIEPYQFAGAALTLSTYPRPAGSREDIKSGIGGAPVGEIASRRGHHPDAVRWFNVVVERKWLLEEINAQAHGSRTAKRRTGRVPALDWKMVDGEVARLMDEHGPFSADDPEWNCQARLEAKIASYIDKTFGENTVKAQSTIRDHVSEALARLRSSSAEN